MQKKLFGCLLLGAALGMEGRALAQAPPSFTPQVREFIKVSAPVVVLTDAKVIDGTGRPTLLHQTVVLRAGRIEQVGRLKKVKVPAGAEIINCAAIRPPETSSLRI